MLGPECVSPSAPAEICATAIPGLDDILTGGLTSFRVYLIEGVPGAGKTTLAMQFLLEGARIGDREAGLGELRVGRRVAPLQQRGATDEIALVELDAEAEPCLVWIDVRRDVGAPHAISLFEPQRVHGFVSARHQASAVAGLPDG